MRTFGYTIEQRVRTHVYLRMISLTDLGIPPYDTIFGAHRYPYRIVLEDLNVPYRMALDGLWGFSSPAES